MLPDLPALKRDVQKIFNRYLQIQRDKRLGMLSEFPKHIMHEGNSSRIVRPDGKVDETELKLASVEMSVKADEVVNLTFNECLARLDQLADDMARQMSAQFFGELNKTLDKAGQVVDQKGKPLDPDAIFAVFEKMQMDFDEHGIHHAPTIVIPPNLENSMKQVLHQIDRDPILQKRYDEIIMQKRMEWRDREAARKLVG